jgi:hypothetical protein
VKARRYTNAGMLAAFCGDRLVARLFLHLIVLSLLVLSGTACAQRAHKNTSVPARFTFPPEWASHDAVWLGWSHDSAHHRLQVEIARALAPTVPVRILVTSDGAREEARAALAAAGVPSNRVDFFTHPVSNTWIRDAGPRFLSDGRNLAVADFAWNWWGTRRRCRGSGRHRRRSTTTSPVSCGSRW